MLRQDKFLTLAPKQDDIWFWFMAYLENTQVCKVHNHVKIRIWDLVNGTQSSGLWQNHNKNTLGTGNLSSNDIALDKLQNAYNENN